MDMFNDSKIVKWLDEFDAIPATGFDLRKKIVDWLEEVIQKDPSATIPKEHVHGVLHGESEARRILVYLLVQHGRPLLNWQGLEERVRREHLGLADKGADPKLSRMPLYYAMRALYALARPEKTGSPMRYPLSREMFRQIERFLQNSPDERDRTDRYGEPSKIMARTRLILALWPGEPSPLPAPVPAPAEASSGHRWTFYGALVSAAAAVLAALIAGLFGLSKEPPTKQDHPTAAAATAPGGAASPAVPPAGPASAAAPER